ncbi:MAG: class I SAM-dependent methyltransferase, partial [Fimbriimonadaceae bacterium]
NNSAHVRGWTKHDMLRFLDTCNPEGFHLDGFGGGNFYPFPGSIAKPLSTMFPNASWSIFLDIRKTKDYADSFLRWPLEQNLETNFFTGEP